ncbi:MAG: CpaF family protein [Alphaproteobacteria bacterium]|nr:MAG: CpaF family protein [Alphaproteobacteria bacterium]
MDGTTARVGSKAAEGREGAAPGSFRDRDAKLARYLEDLKPIVLEAFEHDDVGTLPRPELAVRIGQIVTEATESDSAILNLLDRRNLVAALITWLLHQSPKAPPAPEAPASTPVPATGVDAPAHDILAPRPSHREASETRSSGGHAKSGPPSISATVLETKDRIEPSVMERLDISAASQLPRDELSHQLREIVNEVLAEQKIRLNAVEQQSVVELLLDDMLGLGPLEPLLADESITDIMINGPQQVYVERRGKLEPTDVKFRNNDHVLNIARRIVSFVGRRVDETVPLVDARLQDGSRVNIIIPPLAIDGPAISIRKFAKKSITLDMMVRQNNMSEAMGTVLKIAARSRLNILISGGTGSGKTTLLNALSQMIDERERIVTIEDAAELQLQQPHVVRLETRPPNLEGTGEITMRDLVKNALRMRPDRIILGEVRGAEAVDMLQAMNTGHDGSLGTIHANRPREALTRLENMVGMAGINLPAKAVRTQIAAAIDMIIQVSRMRDGMRRITHITEVIGMEGDIITTQDLFVYEFEGEGLDGMLKGTFRSTGLRPHFAPKASYFGLERRLMECM